MFSFIFRYKNFSFPELSRDDVHTESVSYLVFKKVIFRHLSLIKPTPSHAGGEVRAGAASAAGGASEDQDQPLLSAVYGLRDSSGQIIKLILMSKFCNKLSQEVLARKKDDNDLFQLAKRLKWGDEMPVKLERVEQRKKIGTPWMKHKQEI